MLTIHYPEPSFQMRKLGDTNQLFDPLRKKWLVITPEEWVRQNFIAFLTRNLNYPAAMIAQEKKLMLGDLIKRFDILVYDHLHQPWMMIECKAPSIKLNSLVVDQILRYHITIPADYLVVTNGDSCYGWQKINGQFEDLKELPAWDH